MTHDITTPEGRAKLRKLREAATPGSVRAVLNIIRNDQEHVDVAECGDWEDSDLLPFNRDRWLADAALIAAARNNLIPSCDALDARDAEIARLRTALREIANHWACSPDRMRALMPSSPDDYRAGIVEGHRLCANIAKDAME